MKSVVNKSECLVSFNEDMIEKFRQKMDISNYKIIPQSVSSFVKGNSNQTNNFIYEKFNIPKNSKIILFPSGIRNIKDPLFVLDEIIAFLIQYKSIYCILIGSIYDMNLYNKIVDKTKNISNFIVSNSMERNDFFILLKESFLLINTSINEGMSNVILEAFYFGVPVLARKNEGNCKLIIDNKNGLIFDSKQSFIEKLLSIIDEDNNLSKDLREKIIREGKTYLKDHFSFDNEVKAYKDLIENTLNKFYFKLNNFSLFFSKNTHPFSQENNELFNSLQLRLNKKLVQKHILEQKSINILEVGCGAGVFSIIFLINNFFNNYIPKEKLNEKCSIINLNLYLYDIDPECILSSYINFQRYKDYFKNGFYEFENNYYSFELNNIFIAKSDLIDEILIDKNKYINHFDYVLANMPQTPRDKHGGNLGVNLYIKLFGNLNQLINKDEENYRYTEIFILHISLSNPCLLNEKLKENDYHCDILFEQFRKVNPCSLRTFSNKLENYLLMMKKQNYSEFNIINENEWIYKVWLKKIYK